MSSNGLLFLTTFVAGAVEAVEALTIVLAVGVVRGGRSTLIGARNRRPASPGELASTS